MTNVGLQTQLAVPSELSVAAGFKIGTSSAMTSRTMARLVGRRAAIER